MTREVGVGSVYVGLQGARERGNMCVCVFVLRRDRERMFVSVCVFQCVCALSVCKCTR